MAVHIYGIRHHGPGSAKSLLRALEDTKPDALLIEGPPEADEAVRWVMDPEMEPPVAILVYAKDEPLRSVYYPVAAFSPEWQALRYAGREGIPAIFMDLPQSHQFALQKSREEALAKQFEALKSEAEAATPESPTADALGASEDPPEPKQDEECQESGAGDPTEEIYLSPIDHIARAAGYSDGERWWERMVEERRDRGLFEAITPAMKALRDALGDCPGRREEDEILRERRREAFMRQTIRRAEKSYAKIAVVCGAWHAPALADRADKKGDEALLAGLPKMATAATWIPWTFGRLTQASGYGAGVRSPGWYAHLFESKGGWTTGWLAKAARAFRDEGRDTSSAHAIEAVRLAEALAALRDRPAPGLEEMDEAILSVMAGGESAPMALLQKRLFISERVGRVPPSMPRTPLQADLDRQCKSFRLKPSADAEDIELDLRKPNDLGKSFLFRRLRILGVPWAQATGIRGHGTFKEGWRLQWKPEFEIQLIEAGIHGNLILQAAQASMIARGRQATKLPDLTEAVEASLFADLVEAIPELVARLQELAAATHDVGELLGSLPKLAKVLRYSDVRQTDTVIVAQVVDGIVARSCVGLPLGCQSLDEDAAAQMLAVIQSAHQAIDLIQKDEYLEPWQAALRRVADSQVSHPLIVGRVCSLLFDASVLSDEALAQRMALALSPAVEPAEAAAQWLEGFLGSSGQILLLDGRLWSLVDAWVARIQTDAFVQLLPLLRRVFAQFPWPEKQQMLAKAKSSPGSGAQASPTAEAALPEGFELAAAEAALPVVARMLGLVLNSGSRREATRADQAPAEAES